MNLFELYVCMHKYSKEEASFTHAKRLSNKRLEEMQQQCVLRTDTDIGVSGTQLQCNFKWQYHHDHWGTGTPFGEW